MGKGLKLEELEVYQVAMEIGELVWGIVETEEFALLSQKLNSYFRLIYGYLKAIGSPPNE